MKSSRAILLCVLAVLLSSCSQVAVMGGNRQFKPVNEVAPHARAMVEGRMTLAECLQQPESKADGGVGCIKAIRDLPPAR